MSFITGPPGIGKTPLIEEVLKNLVDRHKFHSVVRLHSSLRELAQFQPIPSKDGPQIVFVDLNREKRCSGYDCAEAMPKLREQDHVIFEGRISPPYPDDSLSIKLAPLTVPDRFRIARSLLPRANPATHILLGGIGGGNLELMHHLAAHFSQTQASEVEFEVEFVAEQIRSWLIRRYTIDQYRGLSDDERHLLYLLSVLRIPLSRDLITGTLANLFDVSIEQLISSLDGLLADGWLCTATSTHPELIMISPWLHPFLVPNDSETPQLHRTAVEILRAIPKSVNITSEISYHYEQAGDLFRAWAERMGALDSLRALSPKNAVLECEQLLKTLKAPTEGLELMGRTQVYCVLGHTWKHLDDMNSARACYEKVLQLEREATDANVSPNELRQIKRIAADAKLGLAEFALMAGVSSEAESYIQSAEKVYLEDGDPAALARSVLMLAYTAQRGGSNDAALENATRALRLAEEGNDLAAASDAQLYLGRFHLRVTGDNAKAKMHFAMAVEHAQKSINSLAEAESRLHLGQILCDEEDHSDAGVAMIEAAIDIYERLGARLGLAKASALLAQAHFKQGEIPDGADELLTAYRTFLELNEDEEATKLKEYLEMILAELQRLGQVFHKEADLYRAKKYFESALAIAGELQVLQDIDFADLRLGIITADEGRIEEAAERFAACRERGLATERWWLATEALHELGNIAIFQEKYDTARDLLEKCLQEKRTHRPESALGPTMHMLAVVCSQTGQFERSHSLLLECVERAEAEKDPLGRTSSMGALAEVLFKRGELEQAATMASECLTDARKFNMNDIVVVCLALLGMIASSKGDKDEAKQYWSEAFVLAKGIGHYAAKDLEKLLTNDSSADRNVRSCNLF
jgi:tetratricopeptide (TPR) repeat protein